MTQKATSAIEVYEEFSDEEMDKIDELKLATQAQGKALQSADQVKDIVKYLMMHAGNPSKVLRALNKLLVFLKQSIDILENRYFNVIKKVFILSRCFFVGKVLNAAHCVEIYRETQYPPRT